MSEIGTNLVMKAKNKPTCFPMPLLSPLQKADISKDKHHTSEFRVFILFYFYSAS